MSARWPSRSRCGDHDGWPVLTATATATPTTTTTATLTTSAPVELKPVAIHFPRSAAAVRRMFASAARVFGSLGDDAQKKP